MIIFSAMSPSMLISCRCDQWLICLYIVQDSMVRKCSGFYSHIKGHREEHSIVYAQGKYLDGHHLRFL